MPALKVLLALGSSLAVASVISDGFSFGGVISSLLPNLSIYGMIIVKIYDFFVIKGLILCNDFIYFDTIRV